MLAVSEPGRDAREGLASYHRKSSIEVSGEEGPGVGLGPEADADQRQSDEAQLQPRDRDYEVPSSIGWEAREQRPDPEGQCEPAAGEQIPVPGTEGGTYGERRDA